MKTAALIFSMVVTALPAYAGTQVMCVENSNPVGAPQRAIVLRQIGQQILTEGEQYPFELEIFATVASTDPAAVIPVTLSSQDVIVSFQSADGQTTGVVFKDELDQSALHFNGEDIGFDCGGERPPAP